MPTPAAPAPEHPTREASPPSERRRDLALKGLFVLVALLAWWVISLNFFTDIIPTPDKVAVKMAALFTEGEFFFHMGRTLGRVLSGFALAFVGAVVVGVIMGINRNAERFLDMGILLGLTIPGLCWAVISLLIFGLTEFAAVFSIFAVTLPMLSLNIWHGTKAVDWELVEMARTFQAGRLRIIRQVILPQLLPYFLAGVRLGLSLAWKVVVVAEMFGLSNGVGYMINASFATFSLTGVVAWTISFTLVMVLIEFGLLTRLERRLTRWRPAVSL